MKQLKLKATLMLLILTSLMTGINPTLAQPNIVSVSYSWPTFDWGYGAEHGVQQPNPGEEIYVAASIEGADEAYIEYSTDGGTTWNIVNMSKITEPVVVRKTICWWILGGKNWKGIIPGQGMGTTVQFRVVAKGNGVTVKSNVQSVTYGWGYLPLIIGFVVVVIIIGGGLFYYYKKLHA